MAETPDRLSPVDVVVVGLGAAGGIVANQLAGQGLRVVALEAGPRVTKETFVFDELANDIRNVLGDPKINSEVPTWRPTPEGDATTSRAGRIVSLMSNGVGGGSIHYAGAHHRFAPWHFAVRSESLARYGPGSLPAYSTVTDWPIGYAELAPYYDVIPRRFSGSRAAAGRTFFEGPRTRDFLLGPLRRTGWTELLSRRHARRRGLHPFAGPAAILSEPYRGQPACTYCGFCNFNGCHADAKGSTYLNVIPRAEATGTLEVVDGARVLSLPVDGHGRAARRASTRAAGERSSRPAAAVVLCAHTFENTRLLLLSRSADFPDGLANANGQVGRNAMSHIYVGVDAAVFPGPDTEPLRRHFSAMHLARRFQR